VDNLTGGTGDGWDGLSSLPVDLGENNGYFLPSPGEGVGTVLDERAEFNTGLGDNLGALGGSPGVVESLGGFFNSTVN